MRSRMHSTVSCSEVHQWALLWLMEAEVLKDRGRRRACTPTTIWSVVLFAAARLTSVFAACRDLANAPSQQAIFDALEAGLPRTLRVLETRLNRALSHSWPRQLKRRSWQVAIDWHLSPYYGQPLWSRNELFRYKMRQGTTRFHAYATACVVQHGQRYTLALTWIRYHESIVTVTRRLLDRIGELGVKIKVLLLDRAFFNTPVLALLKGEKIPFLLPVMATGRRPKRGSKRAAKKGLRWLKRQKAGWYRHTMKNRREPVTFSVCVSYRTYYNRKQRRRGTQKLLFAAWRVRGTPTEIRERYRKRFGIESSFRQMRQARIYTCTQNPHLRLVFVTIALLLRNLWVWIHATRLANGRGPTAVLRLELLRLKQLLDWIAQAVAAVLHDGSAPSVVVDG
jgi:DDE family transposase